MLAVFGKESCLSGARMVMVTDPGRWDGLVVRSGGEIFHTSRWLELVSVVERAPVFKLGLESSGELVAGLPLLVRRVGPFRVGGGNACGIVSQHMVGPLWTESEWAEPMLGAFAEFQRNRRIDFVQLRLKQTVSPDILASLSFKVSPYVTAVLDLEGKTAGDMWGGFRGRVRTQIRKAERMGVSVDRADDLSFLPAYLQMLDEVATRKPMRHMAQGEAYSALWNRFYPTGEVVVLLARRDGRLMGARVLVSDSTTMYALDTVGSVEGREVNAGSLMHWAAIQLALDRSLLRYDMLGAAVSNLQKFKVSFGAEVVHTSVAARMSTLGECGFYAYQAAQGVRRKVQGIRARRSRATSAHPGVSP